MTGKVGQVWRSKFGARVRIEEFDGGRVVVSVLRKDGRPDRRWKKFTAALWPRMWELEREAQA